MLALGTSDFVWFEVMASVSPIASADFGDPPHRLSTGDDHPLDKEYADLDSAFENQVCEAGKGDSRTSRLHRWTRTKVRMMSSGIERTSSRSTMSRLDRMAGRKEEFGR